MIINEIRTDSSNILQWHPVFYADIQIELEKERDNLIFENEHQLGTKPMEIDVLVIKKKKDISISKNIGRIFRKYNIIEYKSPTDYMSINDFYKVCGYAFFYKSNTVIENEIPINEITISLVSSTYPRKLIRHLQEFWGWQIKLEDEGIYYILGFKIPIQIIVTKQLSGEKNLWLRSLTDKIKDRNHMKRLLNEYREKQGNVLYESVMQMIIRANGEKFQEVDCMCEALNEIIQMQFEQKLKERQRQGEEQGMRQGTLKLNSLILRLAELGRTDDIIKSASDTEYQQKLLMEFGLVKEQDRS